MSLSSEEKTIIQEALGVYLQLLSRQAPPQQVQAIAQVAQGIVKKLDTLGAGDPGKKGKIPGISDEWYKNVCQKCDKLTPSGCSDKVTIKFPGKCDPILKYENSKKGLAQPPTKSLSGIRERIFGSKE